MLGDSFRETRRRRLRAVCRRGAPVALVALLLLAGPATAQRFEEDFEAEDTIAIEQIDRDIVAFDGFGGVRGRLQLARGETLDWMHARGRVAIAVTDRRVIAASASRGITERPLRLHEARPRNPVLGDRVALIPTSQRVVAFRDRAGFAEISLGPGEDFRRIETGTGAAVLITNRRALGISTRSAGFAETRIRVREEIERVRLQAALATVTTSDRVLVFSGLSGAWSARGRTIR